MSLLSRLAEGLRRARSETRRDADVVRQSGLLDAEWYRAAYPDAARSALDPVEDYLAFGASASRNPNAFFDASWYLERNQDVRDAGIDPLIHYIESGAAEGRDPGPDFDIKAYRDADPAVSTSGLNPLAHYLLHGRAAGRPAKPPERDTMEDYEAALLRRRSVAGAAAMDHVHFPLNPPTGVFDEAGRPLPPLSLAQRIGAPDFGEYEMIGRGTRRAILRCLPQDFAFEGARVLDFGCGVGRVLRHFDREARQAEFWGCDIDGPSIRWCVENMSPPFRFFQLSEIPTIPMESNSFDLIYAVSVFAHIHADWHHWMAEVRRILKPGGYAFVTFMAQTPHEEMLRQSFWDRGPDFGKYVKHPFHDWNDGGGPMAFHNPNWIKAYWGNLFDIDFIALEGLLEYQSICVMRKPLFGTPVRTEAPILKHSTAQAFAADAVGWIHEDFDETRSFTERFGVEVCGAAAVRGWIVFRGDQPVSIETHIDGVRVGADVEFNAGRSYRDWKNTVQTAFAVRFDASHLAQGVHRLELVPVSHGGKRHALSIPLVVLAD